MASSGGRTDQAHDRTLRLARSAMGVDAERLSELLNYRVALVLADQLAGNAVAELAFLTLVNLATRLGPFCPWLDVHAPEARLSCRSPIYSDRGIRKEAARVLRSATDMRGLHRGRVRADLRYDLIVAVGPSLVPGGRRRSLGWTGWEGWVADADAKGFEQG